MGLSPLLSGPQFSYVHLRHMRNKKRNDGVVVKPEALALVRSGFKSQLRHAFSPCGQHYGFTPYSYNYSQPFLLNRGKETKSSPSQKPLQLKVPWPIRRHKSLGGASLPERKDQGSRGERVCHDPFPFPGSWNMPEGAAAAGLLQP